MTPGEWATSGGKPAIIWHRPGIAAKGEPSVVEEVRTYDSDAERLEAVRGAQAPTFLEHLQALGFSSQEDYQDHQRVIQASRDLVAEQMVTLYTEPREGPEYPRG